MKKTLTALLSVFAINSSIAIASDKCATYEVTVTNASTHQVLTPPLLVAHKRTSPCSLLVLKPATVWEHWQKPVTPAYC